MTLDDFQTKYDFLLENSPISKEMLHLLRDWSLELIKANNYKEAQDRVDEYLFRAFRGDLSLYEGFQFFSFRGFSEYSLKDISEETLSVAHPEEFNDPLDTVLFAYLQLKIKEEKDFLSQQRYCMLLNAAHQLRMRCFVRTTPIDGEDGKPVIKEQDIRDVNPLMWAHYAQYHSGFCALYELDDSFVRCDNDNKSFTRMAKLEYQKTIDISRGLTIGEAFLWKNAIWEYEHEVRVINFDLSNKLRYKELTAPPLKAIYLGLKCSDENRHKMEFALRRKNVALYQMHLNPSNICQLIPERIG